MSIGNAILGVLGLAPQFQQAEAIISASKTGYEAISALKEMLESEEGQKFKAKIVELVAGTSQKTDGSVHIDAKPASVQKYAKGEWVFDSLRGYVWTPEE